MYPKPVARSGQHLRRRKHLSRRGRALHYNHLNGHRYPTATRAVVSRHLPRRVKAGLGTVCQPGCIRRQNPSQRNTRRPTPCLPRVLPLMETQARETRVTATKDLGLRATGPFLLTLARTRINPRRRNLPTLLGANVWERIYWIP
jgi:hypothetical protein